MSTTNDSEHKLSPKDECKETRCYEARSAQSDLKSETDRVAVLDEDFNSNLNLKNEGSIEVSDDPEARKIANGLRINWMDMRDADSNVSLWNSGLWTSEMLQTELEARIPKEVLNCRVVSREMNFTSMHEIKAFRIEQRFFLNGTCIEEWNFKFGFVIKGSTNSWQNTVQAAPPGKIKVASELSGKTTVETSFFDGNTLIAKALVRIFYV